MAFYGGGMWSKNRAIWLKIKLIVKAPSIGGALKEKAQKAKNFPEMPCGLPAGMIESNCINSGICQNAPGANLSKV